MGGGGRVTQSQNRVTASGAGAQVQPARFPFKSPGGTQYNGRYTRQDHDSAVRRVDATCVQKRGIVSVISPESGEMPELDGNR
jgi:hypothetical protein